MWFFPQGMFRAWPVPFTSSLPSRLTSPPSVHDGTPLIFGPLQPCSTYSPQKIPGTLFFKKMKVLSYELLPVIKCTDFKSTNQYILTNGYILPPCQSSHRMFISRPTFPWCPSLVNYLPSRGNESSDFCYQSSVLPVSEDRMNGTHTTYLLCIWISFTRHNIFEMYSYCRVHSIYHFIDEQCPIV